MYRLLFLLFPFIAHGLDNCVKVTEAASQVQTARPLTISRFFARGEIANYPKPVVEGLVPDAWQADVKTRWADGSVMHAYVSWRQTLSPNQTVRACFDNSTDISSDPSNTGLTQQQMVDFDTGGGTGSWSSIVETTLSGITYSANAKDMINAGKWSYWLRGPVVTRVLVEDIASPQPAYDFGYEYDFTANASDGWTASLGSWLNSSVAKWNSVQWKPSRISGSNVAKGAVTTFTMTNHGLTNGQQMYIYCSRTDSWTAVRGTFTVTVADANTFTIAVDSSAWSAPTSVDYFYLGAARFQLGFGSANSYNPDYALAVELNGTQYRLLVRDNGTQYTVNFETSHNLYQSTTNFPYVVRFIADGAAQKILVVPYYPGQGSSTKLTICTSGCSVNVSAGFFSQSWVPLRVSTDANGNAVPVQETTLYRGSRWKAPTDNKWKSLHPIFSAAFYPSVGASPQWSGVEFEAILENCWTTKFQAIPLENLSVKSGIAGATTNFSKNYWQMSGRKAFSRLYWSGTEPASIHVDHNIEYMVYTRLIPPYMYKTPTTSSLLTGWISSYNSNLANSFDDRQHCWLTSTTYCALWQKYIPGPGGRQDIALVPGWYAGYLFAMGDNAIPLATKVEAYNKLVLGQADAFFAYPLHWRESDTYYRTGPGYGQRYFYYQAGGSTPAYGHPLSFSARPTIVLPTDYFYSATAAQDLLYRTCTSEPCKPEGVYSGYAWPDDLYHHGWSGIDPTHWPSAFMMPYILSGRYSYLLGQIYSAVAAVGVIGLSVPAGEVGCSIDSQRCSDWGLVAEGQPRGTAWPLREAFLTYLILPDDSLYKQYHQDIVKRNDEMWEGINNIRNGNYAGPFTCTPAAGIATRTKIWYGKTDYGYLPIPNSGVHTSQYTLNGQMRWAMAPVGSVVDGTGFKVEHSTDGGGSWINKTVGQWGVDSGRDWYWEANTPVVRQDPSATPYAGTDQIRITAKTGTIPNPWCNGWHSVAAQQPPGVTYGWNGSVTIRVDQESGGLDQRYLQRRGNAALMFQMLYLANVLSYMRSLGLPYDNTGKQLFKFSGAQANRWLVDAANNKEGFEYQYMSNYQGPKFNNVGSHMQTWADYQKHFVTEWKLNGNITASDTTLPFIVGDPLVKPYTSYSASNGFVIKIDSEYIQVSILDGSGAGRWNASTDTGSGSVIGGTKGRGLFGSSAAAHSTGALVKLYRTGFLPDVAGEYQALYVCGLSQTDDFPANSLGTARGAFEKVWSNILSAATWPGGYPGWACSFRDKVENVRVQPAANSVTILYSAPSGAACKYLVATSITSFDDTNDTADSGGARARQFTVNGLQPATAYQYRISCGSERATGTFTTQ